MKPVVDSELKKDLELQNPATWDSPITVFNTYFKSHDSFMQTISGNTNPTAPFKSSGHKPHGKPSLFCHHCKKMGHRTSSCCHAQLPSSNEVSINFPSAINSAKLVHSKPDQQPLTNSSTHAQPHSPHLAAKPNPVEVVCYACGEKKHKSPACPSRRPNHNPRRYNSRKQASVHAVSKPSKQCVLASITDKTFPMELDSGASITGS